MNTEQTNPLDSCLPELGRKLRQASAAKQRAAALAACEVALSHAKVHLPLVDEILLNMRLSSTFALFKRGNLHKPRKIPSGLIFETPAKTMGVAKTPRLSERRNSSL